MNVCKVTHWSVQCSQSTATSFSNMCIAELIVAGFLTLQALPNLISCFPTQGNKMQSHHYHLFLHIPVTYPLVQKIHQMFLVIL